MEVAKMYILPNDDIILHNFARQRMSVWLLYLYLGSIFAMTREGLVFEAGFTIRGVQRNSKGGQAEG